MAFTDNLVENIKLFFSQGYTEIYNKGKAIDGEALNIPKQWEFGIYHLLDTKLSQKLDFISQFNLEEITLNRDDYQLGIEFFYYFPNCMKEDFETLMAQRKDKLKKIPKSYWESYLFYYQNVEDADWGSVGGFRVCIEDTQVIVINVSTDGGDGYLEVFDREGQILGASRHYSSWRHGGRIAWCEKDWIHSNLRAYPPEIDPKLRRKR